MTSITNLILGLIAMTAGILYFFGKAKIGRVLVALTILLYFILNFNN